MVFFFGIYLQHILYRQKEQFSDGVGYSWIDGLKAHAELHVCLQDELRTTRSYFRLRNTLISPQPKKSLYVHELIGE